MKIRRATTSVTGAKMIAMSADLGRAIGVVCPEFWENPGCRVGLIPDELGMVAVAVPV